jgi:hypothetical protein
MLRSMTRLLVCATITLGPTSFALAKGGTPQNHHCMKDGAELTGKTRRECKKEGGTWDKLPGAAKPTQGDAAKPAAPAEAPKAAAPRPEAKPEAKPAPGAK